MTANIANVVILSSALGVPTDCKLAEVRGPLSAWGIGLHGGLWGAGLCWAQRVGCTSDSGAQLAARARVVLRRGAIICKVSSINSPR